MHEARFLPGPTCTQEELWLAGRHIGLTGLEPVSKYYSKGLGFSGRVTSNICWLQEPKKQPEAVRTEAQAIQKNRFESF
jgi:hypothetical protein